MRSRNSVLNSLCFVILMFLCNKPGLVKSANETVCSEQFSLMPYDGSCSQSSQCITNSGDIMCVCPVNTHYNSYTASCALDCNATTPNPSGQIVSPNYPSLYPDSNLCTWTLTGTSSSYYVFSISDMDIENNHNCTYDSLKIYDGTSGTQLATFCNRDQTTINVVASTTNSMHIVFKTNVYVKAKGFSLAYRIFDYNTIITEPRNGYIAIPGHPWKSPANSHFSWTILGRPGSFISLSIRNLTLEPAVSCSYDYVQVYDGNNSDARILTQMCPNKDDQRVFTSTGSSLHIAFRSYSSIERRGFLASYEINDFQLSVVLKSPPKILTKDVTFYWTSSTLHQLVAYNLTWVATEDSSDRGEKVASSSGVQVQGLTPGTEYIFTVLSTLQGNEYYNDSVFTTHFTLETLPAPPGKLNESSSNLNNIPYVLRFEPSEGRVARYSLTVGGKSYEVFNPEMTIKDLTPDTHYNYTITAYNKQGVGSEEVDGVFKTDPEATVKQEEESLNVALIAGVTAAAVFVAIISVALVVKLVVRKRRGNSKPPASETLGDIDHNEIVGGSPNAPTPSTRAVMNMYMTSAGLRANVDPGQMVVREYDYVNKSHIDA